MDFRQSTSGACFYRKSILFACPPVIDNILNSMTKQGYVAHSFSVCQILLVCLTSTLSFRWLLADKLEGVVRCSRYSDSCNRKSPQEPTQYSKVCQDLCHDVFREFPAQEQKHDCSYCKGDGPNEIEPIKIQKGNGSTFGNDKHEKTFSKSAIRWRDETSEINS